MSNYSSVKVEIEQNVIRLQHHSSIAIWAGNNENEVALRGNWYGTSSEFIMYKEDYIKLYVNTIKPIVEGLDPGRRYVVSSPSNGKESEQEGYIAQNPYDPSYGDTHYYNYFLDNWNQNIYPKTRFASEYGFQSLPSLLTMSTATKNESDYNVHSQYSTHRQHCPGGYGYIDYQMTRHLQLSSNDPKHFEKYIYYSQVGTRSLHFLELMTLLPYISYVRYGFLSGKDRFESQYDGLRNFYELCIK